jgi:hypothetical protein
VTGRTPVIAHHLIPHLLLLPHLLVVAPHVHGHALALAHHRDGQGSICAHHAITHTQSRRKAAKGQRTGTGAHGIDAAAAVDGAIVRGTKLVRTMGVTVPALCRGWGACLMNAWMRESWTNLTGRWKNMSVPVFRPLAWLHSSSTSPYAASPLG